MRRRSVTHALREAGWTAGPPPLSWLALDGFSTSIPPSNKFDRDTAVCRKSAGCYTATVTSAWSVGDAPNGGYLMAIAISAARQEITHRDPLSVTAHYVAAAEEGGEGELQVTVLNRTKGQSLVSVGFSQGGKLRSHYLATFGDLSRMRGLTLQHGKAPQLPPLEDCLDASALLRSSWGDKLRVAQQVKLRVPQDGPFAQGALKGRAGSQALLEGWGTFEDGRMPCLRSTAFFLDAYPPPILNVKSTSWVPTLEYTVHFRARPAKGPAASPWVRVRFQTKHVVDGVLETDGELWDAAGTMLLGQSRQLARLWEPKASL